MIVRLLLLAFIVGGLYFLVQKLLLSRNSNQCSYCEGLGYWKGLRGDRNNCKECNGTGIKQY